MPRKARRSGRLAPYDLKRERASQATCKEAIAYCESAQNHVSREILEHILDDTEKHIDWLETQLDLIKTFCIPHYLQSGMTSLE